MYPVVSCWAKCLKNHNVITMYPLDTYTLAPSVYDTTSHPSVQWESCSIRHLWLATTLSCLGNISGKSSVTMTGWPKNGDQAWMGRTSNLWTLWEFFESLWENWATLRVYCGYFTKNPLGTLWSNCWVFCERTQRVLSQNTLWVLCKSTHHLPAGYEPGELVGTFWKQPILTC